MQSDVYQAAEWYVVKLSGDIDMHTSPNARKAILRCVRDNHPVIVDMAAVSYIDSSGIATLVEGLQAAKSKRLAFGLFGASSAAMSVLKLARLDKVFTFYPTLPSANA
jgi:anti-sigma B factor antagonist